MTATADLAIDLRSVAKTYRGRVYALRGVDMRVRRGEVFGLLGPNGAGKSTLIKIIMTVIKPTTASGTVLGAPVGDKPTLARVGYLPENHRFPRYLTGRQTLDFFAALAKVPRKPRRANADRLLDVVGMTAWADKKIGQYSKGMMQRVGLAQAMMSDPDLILLDEPTDGVDPVGRREIRDVLLSLKNAGKTVFINSHLLSELEMVCDRVGIMVGGQIAQMGTLDELALGKGWYEIQIALDEQDAAQSQTLIELQRDSIEGTNVTIARDVLRVATLEAAQVQPVLDRLRAANVVIRRVQLIRPSLEDLFMTAVRERVGDHTAAGANLSTPHHAPLQPAGHS